MRFHRSLVSGVFALITACSAEPPGGRSNVVRSDSLTIDLLSDPASLAAQLGVRVDSLRSAGEERYARQSYDSARAIWKVELARAVAIKDDTAEARARMWIGLAAWRLGDYAAARIEGESSLALKRRLGLDSELSRSYNALGLLAWNEGRHRDALASFDSAIATARRHDDAAGIARAAANVPLVKVELGDFEGARTGFRQAIASGRAVDDDRTQGNALANLAMLEIRLGNPAKSLPLLAQARTHYAKIDYATGEANALGQLATAWSGLGDLQRALAEADSALTIARSAGLQQEVASILEVIADLHSQAGSLRFALRYLHEADSIDRVLGLAVERGTNLRRTAAILLELGELPTAIARSRDAIAVHQQVESKGEEIYDRIQLAESLARNRELRSAAIEALAAMRTAAGIGNPSAEKDAARVAARIALDSNDPARALEYLKQRTGSISSSDWRASDLRAAAYQRLGKLDEAQTEGEYAVAALERERSSLGVGQLRSEYFASRIGPVSRLVSIHLARRDTAEAFRVAASLPGRSLAERLAPMAGFGPASHLADAERLLVRAAALENQMSLVEAGPGAAAQRRELERQLERARGDYEAQMLRRASVPRGEVLARSSVSLRDVQLRLAGDEALLTFLVGPDDMYVFVVRRGRIYLHRSAIRDRALASRVRVAREALNSSRPDANVPKALGDLHDLLLGDVVVSGSLSGVSRLIIVPHGSLGALPFAALWDKSSAKFLVEQHTIVYLPAIAAIRAQPSGIAQMTRGMIFAPLPDSLPGTVVEARTVSGLEPNATVRTGSAANERAVRFALQSGFLVHIASHGSHNAQNPMFSGITVGHGGTRTPMDDGRLNVYEILTLTTSSPLVFLSGCETGLGSAGDGPFAVASDEGSLAQAFLFAGVRNVVATLWPVSDTGAAAIASSFYGNLRRGLVPDEALSNAQREAIRSARGFTWAAYAISGIGPAKVRRMSVKRGDKT